MFRCVRVPASDEQPVEEMSLSKSGGLEQDMLRLHAEETFSNDATHALDSAAQQEATRAELVKSGMDAARVSEVMSQLAASSGGKAPRLGSSVEIVCVGLAVPDNGYKAVSMYCDGNAQFKKSLTLNRRATKLVQAAGHGERLVYGDAFFGRAHDDESCEWQRLDFGVSDTALDANWVVEAARHAVGKNMDKYTTSGSLQSALSGAGGGSQAGGGSSSSVFSASDAAAATAAAAASTDSSWTQSNEEMELRYRLPAGTTAKQLAVTISRKALHVSYKAGAPAPLLEGVPENVQKEGGAALYDAVVVGDSTWSVDAGELVITLTKGKICKWPTPFD